VEYTGSERGRNGQRGARITVQPCKHRLVSIAVT
jgi:hypothetical protein